MPERTALVVGSERLTTPSSPPWPSAALPPCTGSAWGPGTTSPSSPAAALAVAAILGAARLGAASAQMNPDLKPGEMAALCEMIGARVGIAGTDHSDKLTSALGGTVLTPDVIAGIGRPRGARGARGDRSDR